MTSRARTIADFRDATVDPVIDAATTPDELKAATPAALQDSGTESTEENK